MQYRRLKRRDIESIAKGLLLDFKELPGFRNAEIANIWPLYGNRGKGVEYYEVKFSSPENEDNGYAIISATTRDFPVVEFSESGLSHFESFQSQIGHQDFRMVRFGTNYITAEDQGKNLLAEIGNRPVIIPEEMQRHVRSEGKSETGELEMSPRPDSISERMGKKPRIVSYKTFKLRYQRPAIKQDRLDRAWERALRRENPGCVYDYFWADGRFNHTYFLQISENTPPNNNDHASGCGGTAWLNIIGWHNLNWTPNLLTGSPKYNNAYIKELTMACHDHIGTYEPWFTFDADQGFTWPDDMPKGYDFIRTHLHHNCNYWWRQDWWNTDEAWVFEVARDVIRAKRPFIVGYYQDWHYAIGYGVAECQTHGWDDDSWIRIYPAWPGNWDKWIPLSTIFAIYGVYSFSPVPLTPPMPLSLIDALAKVGKQTPFNVPSSFHPRPKTESLREMIGAMLEGKVPT
jgi:hypothetical protein